MTSGEQPPETNEAPGAGGSRWPGGRRGVLVAALAVVVVLIVGVVLLLNRQDGESAASDRTAATSSTSTSSTPSSSAVPASPTSVVPSAAPGDDTQLPPSLPAVPLGSQAAVGNGVSATLPTIEAIQGSATGPGNISGPAIRVTVRLANGTGEPVSLDGVAVNMYYGADLTPASPLEDPSQRPFSGTVAPGGTADGIYVFTVPSGSRDAVTVEVGYQAGAPFMTWSGPVG
jgi:hypothetical protein